MTLFKCVATLFVLLAPVWAQAQSPAPAAHPRILTENDFRAFLLATTWTWTRQGASTDEKIRFLDDGTAHHSFFVAKFSIKNTHEIEMVFNRQTAKLTFDPTYSRYDGTDFGGGRAVEGERVVASPDISSNPMKPTVTDATKEVLTSNIWAFEAPQVQIHSVRAFDRNGTWKGVGSAAPEGTWKIEGDKLLITVNILPQSPEIYSLPLKKTGWEGTGAAQDPVILSVTNGSSRTGVATPSASASPLYFGTSSH